MDSPTATAESDWLRLTLPDWGLLRWSAVATVAAIAVTAGLLASGGRLGEAEQPMAVVQSAFLLEDKVISVAVAMEHKCMEQRGFDVHPDNSGGSDYILVPAVDEANRTGFGAGERSGNGVAFEARPEAYQRSYKKALAGYEDWDYGSDQPLTDDSCLGRTNVAVWGTKEGVSRPLAFDPDLQQTIYGEDPALVAAYAAWRVCMKSKGDYPDFKTMDDVERYAAELYLDEDAEYDEASAREIRVAVDASTCASGAGLRDAYTAARDKVRRELYHEFLPDILAWRAQLAAALRRTGVSLATD
ncbi:hypothetical protein Afil01_18830 [Actinorhabdospora filicis]|uniref:Uncharacterized protein n=1 Tax=Actinorhabdospora filicis TaxID=1785913 RepID=A0A9W6W928_9ACTN|nr:hypothetical protein [Actinorhabdospora filicis]GLZ77076.1 hypothetical protein Afil01_18830 [Actinorhabdospora filicis]